MKFFTAFRRPLLLSLALRLLTFAGFEIVCVGEQTCTGRARRLERRQAERKIPMKTDAPMQLNVEAARDCPVDAPRIGDRDKAVELGLKVDTYALMVLAFAEGQAAGRAALQTAAVRKTG